MQHPILTLLGFSLFITSTGELDQSFGVGGRVVDGFFGNTDIASYVLIDANNKILIGGSASKLNPSDHAALARYNNDGSADKSFGNNGKVATHKIGEGTFLNDGIHGMVLQSTGKIVTCGRANRASASGFVIARYNNDGALDNSFGAGAMVFVADSQEDNHPLAITIDKFDRIVVAAAAVVDGRNSSFAIFRYLANGSIDRLFGVNGAIRTSITDGMNVPRAVKVDDSGRIVVAGFSGRSQFTVVRYNENGALDLSFADQGIATIVFKANGIDTLHALQLQSDGKIVVGGDVQVGSYGGMRMVDFGLARLNEDGKLDLSFNHTGTQITSFVQPAASTLWALTLQPDGKIVAVGDASITNSLGVARYNTDGSLDETFGDHGEMMTKCGSTCHWEGVALQPDGKIVSVGYVWNGKFYEMSVVRYK